MSDTPTKFTSRHKLFLASLATISLSLGAAGIVSAAQNPDSGGGNAPASEEVPGVDCVEGIDAATGAECDGGPSASAANDPAEENDAEENEEVDGVDCENGIDAATGADCDGGPSANPQDGADDAAEESSEAANE